jgi:hypothetical protein
MSNQDDLYKNIIILLKVFKNRPYHLAKYLVDNKAFTEDFIKKIMSSDRIKNISEKDDSTPIHFTDINQMNEFYNSFIDDIKVNLNGKSSDEVIKEYNNKLDNMIKSENYEEAAKIRDFMGKNGIKRINNLK